MLPEKKQRVRKISISQETYSDNGILVCAPNKLDKKLLDIASLNGILTLDDYQRWLKKNMRYQRDHGKDIWLSPIDMIDKKAGDCEDFAFFNAAMLKIMGYDPCVLLLSRGLLPGHAICVFRSGKRFFYFDNYNLKETTVSSMEDLAQSLFKNYICGGIYKMDLASKSRKLLFRK